MVMAVVIHHRHLRHHNHHLHHHLHRHHHHHHHHHQRQIIVEDLGGPGGAVRVLQIVDVIPEGSTTPIGWIDIEHPGQP